MRKAMIALTIAFAGGSLAAVPAFSEAQARERVLVCKSVKKKARNGAIVGAVTGGLLGSAIAGNSSNTEGTIAGAALGGVAGHQIAKSSAKKRNCRYVYR